MSPAIRALVHHFTPPTLQATAIPPLRSLPAPEPVSLPASGAIPAVDLLGSMDLREPRASTTRAGARVLASPAELELRAVHGDR